MQCHICSREAIDRCYTCGELFCDEHGRINCSRCTTAIAAGDARTDRVSGARLSNPTIRPGWWRPQPAEDYNPPECQECQGLARYVCVNCAGRYCREHAGRDGLCGPCQRSRRGGTLFMVIHIFLLAGLTLLALVLAHLPQGS